MEVSVLYEPEEFVATVVEPNGIKYDGTSHPDDMQLLWCASDDTNCWLNTISYVHATTYCNPVFGVAATAPNGVTFPKAKVPDYVDQFPFAQKVTARLDPEEFSGSFVPVLSNVPNYPDHYFKDGATGRLLNGTRVSDATPCIKRDFPVFMLAPICQKTASSVSAGCFGSRSYTDKDVNQVEFTILDSHVSNGVWVGLTETPLGTSPPLYEYTSKSVAWTFSKKHNSAVERLFLKDPNLMSLDLIKGISASNLLIAPESLFNAAFSSFVLNDDHSSAVGYLNHPDAFFADFFNIGEDATVTLGNQQIKKNCKDNFAGSTTTTNFFCMHVHGRQVSVSLLRRAEKNGEKSDRDRQVGKGL